MAGQGTRGTKRGPQSKRSGPVYVFNDFDGTDWLLRLALGAALSGGAIRIGLTRDMGALAVGVYKGEEYGTEYVRPTENLAEQVREIMMGWDIPHAVWDDEAGQWILP